MTLAIRSFALLVTLAALSACGGSNNCTATTATGTSSVQIKGLQFVPSCFKVSVGQTVTFTNADTITHQVTSTGFDSGSIAGGSTYRQRFTTAGTFDLHCPIHSESATVVVQ